MYTSDRLHRDADEEILVGHPYNSKQIEDAIQSDRWPMVECKICGGTPAAAIRQVSDTREGGVFEFVAPECTKAPSETRGE